MFRQVRFKAFASIQKTTRAFKINMVYLMQPGGVLRYSSNTRLRYYLGHAARRLNTPEGLRRRDN